MAEKNQVTEDRQPSGLEKLNNALFDQLDRLNDPNLEGDELEQEMKRAQSVTSVSKEIVANARTALDAGKIPGRNGQLLQNARPAGIQGVSHGPPATPPAVDTSAG